MIASGLLYHPLAARSEEQRREMAELEAAGICIFCPEQLGQRRREPIESMGRHWYITKNHFPYEGAAAHYLIVPHRHVVSFDELPDESGADLWAIRRMLKRRLAPRATATVERSGDMRYNGGSVAHLHVHFVTLDDVPLRPVRFRVSGAVETTDLRADPLADGHDSEPVCP